MRKVAIRGLAARKLRLALTALAIVLGVTFVTGTLVLGDTLNRTFDSVVGTAYEHISFVVQGEAAFSGDTSAAVSGSDREPVPESVAAAVGRLSGVAYVYGAVKGYAQFIARDGDAIGGGGTSTLGFSFDPNQRLSPYKLVAGRPPTASNEVVMDKATATKYHFAVGDRVLMNVPSGAKRFTISGIVTFGADANLAGITLAGFSLQTAQTLFNLRGRYDTIDVLAKPGADSVALQHEITGVLPRGVQVVSGQAAANELSSAINSELSFISTVLLIFAFIALFVGAFTIFNTFSITVSQRTRELALLRIVGASRGQVFRSVLVEAGITGIVASLIGLGLGVAAALGLKALLKAFGIVLPSSSLVFEARTPIVAIAVGVGVTVISAIFPARRAVSVPPIAALADQAGDEEQSLRGHRLIGSAVIAIIGLIAVVTGAIGAMLALVGVGALAVCIAAVMLGPIVSRPLSSVLGRPLAALAGMPGRLGRENSMRNPGRTAQTAAALMIGLILVSTIAVLGDSLSASTVNSVDTAINADYIISGNGGFSTAVMPAVSRVPGVTTATTVYQGQFEFRGSLATLTAVSTTRLPQTINLHVLHGSGTAALAAGQLLVDSTTAAADDLHVGSVVTVRFARTGAQTMRIGGIFKPNPLAGSFFVGEKFFLAHFTNPLPIVVLLRTAPGTRNLNRALNRILDPYANVSSKTRSQFVSNEKHQVDQLLGLIYVLLALAIVIALIGIVNTLLLSVFERTREIGLLRAIGMTRRQVRQMIRAESVVVAVFGALVGIAVGTGLGAAIASSLRNSNVTVLAVPAIDLIVFLVLSVFLGLLAATWPARRAANLEVLAAIAAE